MGDLDIPGLPACEFSDQGIRDSGNGLRTQRPIGVFFEALIKPLEDRIIRSIWRITRNQQDAEDAMQNALMAICHNQLKIEQHSNPQALVLKICIDAACDIARKQNRDRRRIHQDAISDQIVGENGLPSEELHRQELVHEILAAIKCFPRCQGIAIALRVFEELSYEEIGAALGCTSATARKHAERARSKLKIVLSKYERSNVEGDRS